MAVDRPILVIVGPTGSGKSALALAVAQRVGAELLSVDSMQVYREMDIGTAKPTPQEQQQLKHHLIDLVAPDQTFAVSQFVEQADDVIASARQRNVPLVAVGGTPMYYKALFTGLFEGPGADEAIRERLKAQPAQDLHQRLTQVDPSAAQRIHVNDTKRLVRALEVFELTGRPISSFQTDWEQATIRHPALWVGLRWERPELNRRINARVRAMVQAGWIEETRGLVQKYGTLSATAIEATGYRQWIDHQAGQISQSDAIEAIKIATRQLAVRQVKWFRRFPDTHWLNGDDPLESLTTRTMELWDRATDDQKPSDLPQAD